MSNIPAKGVIFDISHYMIEDGPGIRTNVFMKGCFLKCKWCSNAYGLYQYQQLAFIKNKCIGCKKCLSQCTNNAITFDNEMEKASMDFNKCHSCFKCIDICPTKARVEVGKTYTSDQVVREVEKDRLFYRRGEGGVTLSGGEILMQPKFAVEILKKCAEAYINTAIETTAYGKWEYLKQMIDYSDTVFIDCKHMDSEQHKRLTGVDNELIHENIRKAAEYCKEKCKQMVVRFPLIPTINDSKENIIATANLVKSLAGNRELNVLPYHSYGSNKYQYIGMDYELEKLDTYTKEQLLEINKLLQSTGVWYSIGGYNVESYS
ncbi:glycyl-radical enzyme activating protein [Clostridium magnum]|uniref:4-hydroxyphenylacetate decarboxylase activating enzyme n=1 Tax=Clostridium magnum DSM 2767 TaxID=1121326 RepID=A0A162R0J7_9CLOT|nr:glycyl-radical enzyme activating protein [Clostridium magnum]KZL89241.1 4-hydroxyphenylacetate decarboxylase activating enzyme [Clostridium magnum DSM 2767]SHJ55659.1 pyruvate formate lyase activating enzyme [Clostridium magnum DSM 2767]